MNPIPSPRYGFDIAVACAPADGRTTGHFFQQKTAENMQCNHDHIVINSSNNFAEKEDAFLRVEVPAKEFMECR